MIIQLCGIDEELHCVLCGAIGITNSSVSRGAELYVFINNYLARNVRISSPDAKHDARCVCVCLNSINCIRSNTRGDSHLFIVFCVEWLSL